MAKKNTDKTPTPKQTKTPKVKAPKTTKATTAVKTAEDAPKESMIRIRNCGM